MVVPNGHERNTARDIVSLVKISDACAALTCIQPRRTGKDTFRAQATWRNGDGWSVSLDNSRGLWHDFVTGNGGGLLDLIVEARGGTRADALRWAADFAGVALDDKPFSAEDRVRWAAERRALERDLPDARHWQRAAVAMCEQWLDAAKAVFFTGPADAIDCDGMRIVTSLLSRLQRLDGAALVCEYHSWCANHPGFVAVMVDAARAREQVERRALAEYLGLTDAGRRAA